LISVKCMGTAAYVGGEADIAEITGATGYMVYVMKLQVEEGQRLWVKAIG